MKFKNLIIIGCGPNAVYGLDFTKKNSEKIIKKKIIIFEKSGSGLWKNS